MSTYDNPYYRGIESLRRTYGDRRGLVPEMLARAEDLMEKSIEHERAAMSGRIEQAQAEADRAVERAEAKAERYRELQQKALENSQTLSDLLDEKRTLRDERQRDGEEVKVTIGRDYRGWWLKDLEEVAYRLRMGGAVDDTPIEVGEYSIRANVPDPNMVSLAAPERPKPELPDTYAKDSALHADHRPMRVGPAMLAVAIATLSVLAGVLLGAVVL